MNKIILMGRLTKDPEVKEYSVSVARFTIAVDRRFKKEGQPTADFFNCTAFGKTAEFIDKYLSKGTKIVLDGELQNDNYEKDGVMRYENRIIVNNIEFAESRRAQEDSLIKDEGSDFMQVSDEDADGIPFA